jgi:hypothetical protein
MIVVWTLAFLTIGVNVYNVVRQVRVSAYVAACAGS